MCSPLLFIHTKYLSSIIKERLCDYDFSYGGFGSNLKKKWHINEK
jgi:hypothetical protein